MGRERQPQLRLPPERCGEVVPGCGSCGQHRGHRGQQGWQQGCLCGQQGCLRAPGGSGCSSQARKRGRERTPTAGMGQRGEAGDPVRTRLGLGQAGFGWCRIRPVSIQPSCRSLLPLPADGKIPVPGIFSSTNGSTSAPGRTLQPTASPQPKATGGRADAKHRAQGAAWQRRPGDLLPRHGQLGPSKAGTTARLLPHENPGVTAHPGCPHGSGTGTVREVLPSLQPPGHPLPPQPWQGTRAEERVKERDAHSHWRSGA